MALGTGEMWDDLTGWGQGSDASSSSSLSIFVPCFFGSGRAGSGRGGGRSQDWSGYSKKKGPLTWRGEGDASGSIASGMGMGRRNRSRVLEGAERDMSGHGKKENLVGGSGLVRTNKKIK